MLGRRPRPNPPQGGSSAPSGPDRPPGTRPPAEGSPADSVTRPSRPPGGGSDADSTTRPSRPPAGGSDGGTGTGIQTPGGVGNRGRLAGIGTVVGGVGLAAGSIAGLVFGLRGADTIDNIVESVTEIVQNPYFLAVAGGIVVVFVMRKKY